MMDMLRLQTRDGRAMQFASEETEVDIRARLCADVRAFVQDARRDPSVTEIEITIEEGGLTPLTPETVAAVYEAASREARGAVAIRVRPHLARQTLAEQIMHDARAFAAAGTLRNTDTLNYALTPSEVSARGYTDAELRYAEGIARDELLMQGLQVDVRIHMEASPT